MNIHELFVPHRRYDEKECNYGDSQ